LQIFHQCVVTECVALICDSRGKTV